MGSLQRPLSAFDSYTLAAATTRWLAALLLAILVGGCTSSRSVQIVTTPPDAIIRIDGVVRGKGRVVEDLRFGAGRAYTVMVSRLGFNDVLTTLDSVPPEGKLQVNLTPRTRRVRLNIGPYPAIVKIDGRPVADGEVTQTSADLTFAVDDKDEWIPHVATAERPGFRRAERIIRFTDRDSTYSLALTPEQKDVTIRTEPPAAEVTVDGESIGPSPRTIRNFVINTDPLTHEWLGRKVHASKPGFESADATISWDEGRTDYLLTLKPIGAATIPVAPPATLPTPPATLPTLPPPATTRAVPPVATTRDVKLLRVKWIHGAQGWKTDADYVATAAPLQTREPGGATLTRVVPAPSRGIINSLASSPDGATLVYDVLWPRNTGIGGQIVAHPLEEGRTPIRLTDDSSLDLMPSFAPDGNRVLFSSRRSGGKGAGIYQSSLEAPADPKRLTAPDENLDLWPSLDSAPQPRLYAESPGPEGDASRLALYQPPDGNRAELPQRGGQPRVSPTADAVIFTRPDAKTGKRDLFLLREGADEPVNLTHSPDDDDFDPAWSKDGMQIAFASDRQTSATRPTAQRSLHIWRMDLNAREPTSRSITASSAWDDSPAWNGDGTAIYFRSNRGGEWAIWRIELK